MKRQPPRRLDIFIFVLLGAVGPLAYFAPLALAALLPVLAVTLLLGQWGDRRLVFAAWATSAPFLWPLAVVALISTSWAIAPGPALLEATRFAVEIAIGLAALVLIARLSTEQQDGAVAALAIGFAAAALLMLTDSALSGILSSALHRRHMTAEQVGNAYSRGAVVHAIILAPLAAALIGRGRPIAAGLTLVIAMIAVYALHSVSAKLSLVFGIGVALATYRWPKTGRLLVLAQCLGILAAPLLLPPVPGPGPLCWLAAHQSSALHRLYIWKFVDRHIVERPVLGWGMDASRRLAGPDDVVTLYLCETPHPRDVIGTFGLLPLHPHNAMLQIWVELGAFGALAAVVALFSLTWPFIARGRDRIAVAAAAGGLAAGYLAAGISFGIWQSWWIASFFFCAAVSRLARSAKILP